MKTTTHRFVVTVRSTKTKIAARSAVLCAFGTRQPDGCGFHLTDYRKPKPRGPVIESRRV